MFPRQSYKRKLAEIPIKEINLEERDFLFSFPERASLLIKSIKEIGLIEPPILISTERGYIVIAGEGRIKALIELGYSLSPALILLEPISPKNLLLIALESNLWRGLNLVEKAFFVAKAEAFYAREDMIKLLPKLGFTPHPKWYFFLKMITLLEDPFKVLLVKEELNPKIVEDLSALSPTEREEFLLVFNRLKPTFNEQREILETLLDLKKRENLLNLLPPELRNILEEEEEINICRKKFMNFLEKLKYPNYSIKKGKIKKIKETLAEKGIKIEYSPYLERKEIFLQIKCSNIEELKERIHLLERHGEEIFRIFE